MCRQIIFAAVFDTIFRKILSDMYIRGHTSTQAHKHTSTHTHTHKHTHMHTSTIYIHTSTHIHTHKAHTQGHPPSNLSWFTGYLDILAGIILDRSSPFVYQGPKRCWGEERRDSSTSGTNTLGKRPLLGCSKSEASQFTLYPGLKFLSLILSCRCGETRKESLGNPLGGNPLGGNPPGLSS